MDLFAKYYTTDIFSQLLINQISIRSPKKIIDLGVGEGSLIKAAIQRWINASYFAIDIDKKSIQNIKIELPFVKSFHLNTLKENISEKIRVEKGDIDIAVCNPPYLRIKHANPYNELFDRTFLPDFKKLKRLTSDIVFLTKNLEILRQNGELGIILPDSLITGKDYDLFRDGLLKNYNLKAVIELPEKIFEKTEALTHMVVIQKQRNKNTSSSLFLANEEGQIVEEIEVDKTSLGERMDFKYHRWKKKSKKFKNIKLLGEIDVEIKRGTLTHKELKASKDVFLHTTNIVHKKYNQSTLNYQKRNPKYLLTRKGDILLARVGRGCVGKVSMISKGQTPLSDCVYRIRVPASYRQQVWSSFTSDAGQGWLKANSHGVCAKVISKRDLLLLPLV